MGSHAHDVITTPITFSREIARIFARRCDNCHRPGGAAFPLLTYRDARPWATAIKEETLERRMPPWGAVKGFGDFADDQSLTQEQIELIADWVEGGAPEGDPAMLPPAPRVAATSAPKAAAELALDGALTLSAGLVLEGIRPKSVPEAATLMVTAQRPDGSIEPLLWLYQFNPRFAHPYRYRAPIRLPAGTRIQVGPAQGVRLALLTR